MLLHLGFSLTLLGGSLVFGMWGYEHYEDMKPMDAFVNSAMLLSGMGPMETGLSDPGKMCAGLFALYSGLLVIAVTGLLLTPGVHHVMKRVHWETDHDD